MYVTGGQYKGRKLITPNGVKPTLSKTRESVFNVLNSVFEGQKGLLFFDMFAGSGIMSLEALSRGYRTISADINKASIKIIKSNLEIAKENYEILCCNSIQYIDKMNAAPDIVYIDPPWDFDYYPIIKKVLEKFKNSVAVVEYDKKRAREFCEIYRKTSVPFKEKVYGRCKIDFIRNEN